MTIRTFSYLLAATAIVGAAACNRDEPQADAVPTATSAPATQQHDDASITTAVQAKYYASDDVRGRNVNVATHDKVVTLTGTVESEQAKQRAVALAREVEGVTRVEDKLTVATKTAANTDVGPAARERAAGTTGRNEETSPAWITTKIQAQYFVNPEVKPWNIEVTTSNDGVVTLEGEVDAPEDRAEAVRIAQNTEGVSRVEDRLTVEGEKKSGTTAGADATVTRPDTWLTAKIQSKYFIDDSVKMRNIDVDTQNGVVTLSGSVASESERRQAVALARNTEGVREVTDRLKTAPEVRDAAAGNADTGIAATNKAEAERNDTDNPASVPELSRPDPWITMKIQSQFFLDADVKGHEINVDTTRGVVVLKGSVASEAVKQEAEQIARETEGVRRVTNQLTVKGGAR